MVRGHDRGGVVTVSREDSRALSWQLRQPGRGPNRDNRLVIAEALDALTLERDALRVANDPVPPNAIPTARALEVVLARCRMHSSLARDIAWLLANERGHT